MTPNRDALERLRERVRAGDARAAEALVREARRRGDERALLEGLLRTPSSAAWDELVRLLQRGIGDVAAAETALDALWPDALRTLPESWRHDTPVLREEPWMRLVRTVDDRDGPPGRLAAWPCLAALRTVRAGGGYEAISALLDAGLAERIVALRLEWIDEPAALHTLLGALEGGALEALELTGCVVDLALAEVLARYAPTSLRELVLDPCHSGLLDAELTRLLARSRRLAGLTALTLRHGGLSRWSARVLGRASWFDRLRSLRVEHCAFDPGALEALLRESPLAHLDTLSLAESTGLTDPGAALAAVEGLGALRALDLGGIPLAAAGLRTLGATHWAERLHTLRLEGCHLDDTALAALAMTCPLGELTRLDLGHNRLRGRGVATLLAATSPRAPRHLRLAHNRLDERSLAAFAKTHWPATLETLDLSGNRLGARSLRMLLGAPCLARLRELDLSHCGLRDADLEALASDLEAHGAGSLERLVLRSLELGPAGVRALERMAARLRGRVEVVGPV